MGLVPMSPKTTPSAPTTSAVLPRRRVEWASMRQAYAHCSPRSARQVPKLVQQAAGAVEQPPTVLDQRRGLVDREARRDRPQSGGDQRAEGPGRLGVVDAAHNPGADGRLELGIADPVGGGELLATLGGRERDRERLTADAELASGAVERRKRELLRGLLDSVRI